MTRRRGGAAAALLVLLFWLVGYPLVLTLLEALGAPRFTLAHFSEFARRPAEWQAQRFELLTRWPAASTRRLRQRSECASSPAAGWWRIVTRRAM